MFFYVVCFLFLELVLCVVCGVGLALRGVWI